MNVPAPCVGYNSASTIIQEVGPPVSILITRGTGDISSAVTQMVLPSVYIQGEAENPSISTEDGEVVPPGLLWFSPHLSGLRNMCIQQMSLI